MSRVIHRDIDFSANSGFSLIMIIMIIIMMMMMMIIIIIIIIIIIAMIAKAFCTFPE